MNDDNRDKSRKEEHRRRVAQRRARRRQTLIWMIIITIIAVLVIGIAHFAPVIIEKFTIVDEYLPRDIERQYWELQDTRNRQPAKQDIATPLAK
ncbi:MAG TPA: hypothetical protein PK175_11170 [Syntrophales bacterium]|nr:hypothetical protein [Syntrophales bacterium]HRR45964.1 hypothetical protein [Syntrophales bacterium]